MSLHSNPSLNYLGTFLLPLLQLGLSHLISAEISLNNFTAIENEMILLDLNRFSDEGLQFNRLVDDIHETLPTSIHAKDGLN